MKTLQIDLLQVRIHPTQAEMAANVAREAKQILIDALEHQPTASVIFAAANSQIQSLHALVQLDGIDWSRVVMFHMDEYLGIDAQHRASFRRDRKSVV